MNVKVGSYAIFWDGKYRFPGEEVDLPESEINRLGDKVSVVKEVKDKEVKAVPNKAVKKSKTKAI